MTAVLQQRSPETCQTLLARFRHPIPPRAQKLAFGGIGHRDVYNIAAPFVWEGRRIIAGRVERRDVELSEIVFFTDQDGLWKPVPGTMTFPGLQDPCVTLVDGQLILGGVRFPVQMADGTTGWRMEFYQGRSLGGLRLVLTGPDRMKDIRMAQLEDRRVAVLTRPQGAKGGRGKIGFLIADRLEEITAEAIQEAPLFGGQCTDDEWVGANEAHSLGPKRLGVLGHIACFDRQEHRHYYPMVFCVNLHSREASAPQIIARRADFPSGPAKRPDLVDVMFSGGLVRHQDGTATLYAGLSDAEAGCVLLADPFQQFTRVLSATTV